MKPFLFVALMLASVAQAEVVNCPARFPAQDAALPASPGASGVARIRPARLSGAFIEIGPLYVAPTVPLITKVKDGWDIEYPLGPADNPDPRWLVCRYGGQHWGSGQIERWEQLPQRFTHCLQKVREIKVPHTTSDWSATTTCR